MIYLTRLNGSRFVLNAEMIREIEATPDTLITMGGGQKIIVRESVDAVRDSVIEYKQSVLVLRPDPKGNDT